MGTCVNKGEALLSPKSDLNDTKPAVLGTCPLQTLGVEGVGHHMLNTMDPALCGGASNCFGTSSLPDGTAWREDGELYLSRDFVLEEMLEKQFFYTDNSRYVVLLRDPLAAKSSALARFQASLPLPHCTCLRCTRHPLCRAHLALYTRVHCPPLPHCTPWHDFRPI